jgi:hypothetical protein
MQPMNKRPTPKGREKPICSEKQVRIAFGKYFQLQIN